MGIKAAIAALFGKEQPRNAYGEREIKFYKDARMSKEHGRVVVSHLSMGLDQVEVPFVFPGMSEPPKLDDRLMTDIRSAAESQGYIFHHLIPHRYGKLIKVDDALNEVILDVVSELNVDGRVSGAAVTELFRLFSEEAAKSGVSISGVDTEAPSGLHADALRRMSDHLTSVTTPESQPRQVKRAVGRTSRAAAINLGGQSVEDFAKGYVSQWISSESHINEMFLALPTVEANAFFEMLLNRTIKGIHTLGETAESTNEALTQLTEQFQRDVALASGTDGLGKVGGSMTLGSDVGTGEGQLKFSRTNGDTTQH